jgi:hypothetical protein
MGAALLVAPVVYTYGDVVGDAAVTATARCNGGGCDSGRCICVVDDCNVVGGYVSSMPLT